MPRIAALVVIALLQGCASYIQTTSGDDYLARHPVKPAVNTAESAAARDTAGFADALRTAAAVEPRLRFPARIGIVRLQSDSARPDGKLMGMADGEVAAWQALAGRLGPTVGEFVPVQPLIIDLMRGAECGDGKCDARTPVDAVRVAAARQHLDAILVYEIGTRVEQDSNILSLGKLTLIGGYLLPSEELDARVVASAMLIDVIEGYPYGTASTIVNQRELATGWGSDESRRRLQARSEVRATEQLAGDVETMIKDLRYALGAQGTMPATP